jgi:hypothetical protein
LIHTSSNTLTKSEIITLENGVKEVYFNFDEPTFNGNDLYNVVINGTGYVPTVNSYIAWRQSFPDTVYGGYTPSFNTLHIAPYYMSSIIGAEF